MIPEMSLKYNRSMRKTSQNILLHNNHNLYSEGRRVNMDAFWTGFNNVNFIIYYTVYNYAVMVRIINIIGKV